MTIATPLRTVRKDNSLCGDSIELSLGIVDGVVRPAGHRAHACSLVRASATLLEEAVSGVGVAEAQALGARVARAIRGTDAFPDGFESIAHVLLLPSRRRCALLPWEALAEALNGET